MFGLEKVTINKTAWHFRWLKWIRFIGEREYSNYKPVYNAEGSFLGYNSVTRVEVRGPKSICPYFWMLVGSFVLFAAGIGVVLGALGLIGLGLFYLVKWCIANPVQFFEILAFVGAAVSLVALVIFGGPRLFRFLGRKSMDRYYKKLANQKEKQPSVVLTYIKAKKEKVCPLVEYVD